MGVGARNGQNREEVGRFNVAGGIEATDVGVAAGRDPAIDPRRPPQAELQQALVPAGGQAQAGRGRGDERGIVDQCEQGRLQELHLRERTLDDKQRDAREGEPPLGTARTRTLSRVRPRSHSKKRGSVPAGRSVRSRSIVRCGEAIGREEAHHLREAGEHGELAVEGVAPEMEVRDRGPLGGAVLPPGVGHGELIRVGQQGIGQRIGRLESSAWGGITLPPRAARSRGPWSNDARASCRGSAIGRRRRSHGRQVGVTQRRIERGDIVRDDRVQPRELRVDSGR